MFGAQGPPSIVPWSRDFRPKTSLRRRPSAEGEGRSARPPSAPSPLTLPWEHPTPDCIQLKGGGGYTPSTNHALLPALPCARAALLCVRAALLCVRAALLWARAPLPCARRQWAGGGGGVQPAFSANPYTCHTAWWAACACAFCVSQFQLPTDSSAKGDRAHARLATSLSLFLWMCVCPCLLCLGRIPLMIQMAKGKAARRPFLQNISSP